MGSGLVGGVVGRFWGLCVGLWVCAWCGRGREVAKGCAVVDRIASSVADGVRLSALLVLRPCLRFVALVRLLSFRRRVPDMF